LPAPPDVPPLPFVPPAPLGPAPATAPLPLFPAPPLPLPPDPTGVSPAWPEPPEASDVPPVESSEDDFSPLFPQAGRPRPAALARAKVITVGIRIPRISVGFRGAPTMYSEGAEVAHLRGARFGASMSGKIFQFPFAFVVLQSGAWTT
jgi:hypothetical protein